MEPRAGAPQALTHGLPDPARSPPACCSSASRWSRTRASSCPTRSSTSSRRPVDFLGRALHLWDAEGAFGQLQNQAYGYLWPMGPFFALGHVARTCPDGWSSGCGWRWSWSVAFVGTRQGGQGARRPVRPGLPDRRASPSRCRRGCSPRSARSRSRPGRARWRRGCCCRSSTARRAARRAGRRRCPALAVAMVGGVNAAATFAVLPLGVIWLLTRTPGPRRRALMLWWPVFTLLGDAVVAGAAVRDGRLQPAVPRLHRDRSVTTFPTTLFDVLRGTSNWVPYVDAELARRQRPASPTPYLDRSTAVSCCMVGLAGLADRRDPRARLFLALSRAGRACSW